MHTCAQNICDVFRVGHRLYSSVVKLQLQFINYLISMEFDWLDFVLTCTLTKDVYQSAELHMNATPF